MDSSKSKHPTGSSEDHTEEYISLDRPSLLAIPLLLIVASETALFFDATGIGLWGHLVTLLFSLIVAFDRDGYTGAFAAFALLATFRLVNFGMPAIFPSGLGRLVLVYGPFLPVLVVLVRSPADVSLRGNVRLSRDLFPAGFGLAIVLANVEYALIEPTAVIPTWNLWGVFLAAIVMIVFVGLVEELLFRGILQRRLQATLGNRVGLLLASGIFGLMHSGYGVGMEMVLAGFIGLLLGITYDLTDSLALVSVLHGILNVVLFVYIPLRGQIVLL